MADPVVDLDAARAARLEALGEAPVVRFDGAEFRLRPELADVLPELSALGDAVESDEGFDVSEPLHAILKKSFAEGEFDRFMERAPAWPDLQELVTALPTIYGLGSLGEASAPPDTSGNGSDGSKPISLGTTGSTSERPHSVPAP